MISNRLKFYIKDVVFDNLILGVQNRVQTIPSDENIKENRVKFGIIKKIAEQIGFKPLKISLVWVLARDDKIIIISPTENQKYLDESIRFTDIVLTKDRIRNLRKVFTISQSVGKVSSS